MKLSPTQPHNDKLMRKIYCERKGKKKGQPGALKLPHSQGPEKGPTIWCIVRSLTLFLHKWLFPGLKPVTLRSHDNNFTSYRERRSEKIEHKMEEWENAQLIYLEITTFHEELHGGFQSNGQGYSRNKEDLI